MKKLIPATLVALLFCSCGSFLGGGSPVGVVYSDVNMPRQATNASGNRTGKSESVSYLGLVALGDSSIEAAKKNGGISTVSAVDTKVYNILGVYTKYTTTVSGN